MSIALVTYRRLVAAPETLCRRGTNVARFTHMDKHLARANAVPDRWRLHAWGRGVQIDALSPLDRLTVYTSNSRYDVIVIRPETGLVLVRGGQLLGQPVYAYVAGSSLGGACIRPRGIYMGFFLALHFESQGLLTTHVRAIEQVPSAGPF